MKDMKKETEIENLALSQNHESKAFGSMYVKQIGQFSILPVVRSKNKAILSDSFCKGPPGRPPIPGARGHPPQQFLPGRSSPLSVCRGEPPELIEGVTEFIEAWPEFIEGQPGVSKKILPFTTTNFIKQNTNDKQILFFKNLLIFKIMKKQILFLAFFVLAGLAGITTALGQMRVDPNSLDAAMASCPIAIPLNCAAGTHLTPMPGETYTYEISVSSTPTMVHWFVTDDPAVFAAGVPTANIDADGGTGTYILDAENGVYNNNSATPNVATSIDISWKSFDGNANEVLLVAYAIDAAGCTDNIQAWRIIPQYNFTLDIAGLLDDGTAGSAECASPVVSATYTGGTDLTMDYGENWVYFTVTAANWMTSWQPTFTIDQSNTATTNSLVDEVMWAYSDEADGAGATWHAATDDVEAAHYEGAGATNGFVGLNGVCIVLRVHVDHTDAGSTTQNESLAAETVVIGVDGEMVNPEGGAYDGSYPDLDNGATPSDPCVNTVTDEGIFTINPRPTITEVTPTTAAGPFEPKN